jgi:protein-S-isoprenylcysteine O-methyltransferase
MALALVEFWGMRLLFSVPASSPAYWTSWWAAGWIIGAGAVLSVAGLCLRYWAMMETGTSFNHIVQDKRPESHRLVTTGPYRISRHPSYVGWALWAVGTQILLCNPISALLFAAASTAFFRKRVIGEEAALLEWYGDEYVRYATNTPILLPGVSTSPRLQARISSMQAAA